GPTNATAFMLFSFFAMHPTMGARAGELMPLLVLLSGLLAALGAVLKVADLLQYVSRSVLVGYISGAGVLIIANQTQYWLGINGHMDARETGTLFGLLSEMAKSLRFSDPGTLVVGSTAAALFLVMKRWL